MYLWNDWMRMNIRFQLLQEEVFMLLSTWRMVVSLSSTMGSWYLLRKGTRERNRLGTRVSTAISFFGIISDIGKTFDTFSSDQFLCWISFLFVVFWGLSNMLVHHQFQLRNEKCSQKEYNNRVGVCSSPASSAYS